MKKKIRIKIIIRDAKEEFKPGLGIGVIASGDFTYDVSENPNYALLNSSIIRDRAELINKVFKFEIEDLDGKVDPQKKED